MEQNVYLLYNNKIIFTFEANYTNRTSYSSYQNDTSTTIMASFGNVVTTY